MERAHARLMGSWVSIMHLAARHFAVPRVVWHLSLCCPQGRKKVPRGDQGIEVNGRMMK